MSLQLFDAFTNKFTMYWLAYD